MTTTTQEGAGIGATTPAPSGIWTQGLWAAGTWLAAAAVTMLPDVVPWGSQALFALVLVGGAAVFAVLAFLHDRNGRIGRRIVRFGPWFIVLGIWIALWELITAKLGWLPKPFFAPPHGLFHVYVIDWERLVICIAYTARLWSLGFGSGIVVGFVAGVALGWSKSFAYWGMPILKLIGPVPASAWIPATFFCLPPLQATSSLSRSQSSGGDLTASGVSSVARAYYDVARARR